MGQMVVCCQNLMLGALSSCSALSMLVGAIFKKFGLYLNTLHIPYIQTSSQNIYVLYLLILCLKGYISVKYLIFRRVDIAAYMNLKVEGRQAK
jgi:hypothetical protein